MIVKKVNLSISLLTLTECRESNLKKLSDAERT